MKENHKDADNITGISIETARGSEFFFPNNQSDRSMLHITPSPSLDQISRAD